MITRHLFAPTILHSNNERIQETAEYSFVDVTYILKLHAHPSLKNQYYFSVIERFNITPKSFGFPLNFTISTTSLIEVADQQDVSTEFLYKLIYQSSILANSLVEDKLKGKYTAHFDLTIITYEAIYPEIIELIIFGWPNKK